MNAVVNWVLSKAIYLAFILAWASTLGSLYFSEIAKFPPCVLCWYQRIVMYPLVVILTVGILKREKQIYLYVLPFTIIGFVIGAYHNLLYYSIIPESIQPCTLGISCTTKYIEWLGFITIPLLSLSSFAIITILMLIMALNKSKK